MLLKTITSLQNPFIKDLLLLEEKPRARKEQKKFVIEGEREILLALAGGINVTDLCYVPELVDPEKLLSATTHYDTVMNLYELSPAVFNRIAYRKDSGGVIAVATLRHLSLIDLNLPPDPLLLVLESVEKPGNLGALLRTADAAAVSAMIICDPQTDLYNPNVIRSSIGCIFTMPVVITTSVEAIAWMRSKKITMFATALTAREFYHHSNFRGPSAIVMGSEANGLSQTWLGGADHLIKIPMMGKIDSMNVSASAAVVVYEAMRQRGFRT